MKTGPRNLAARSSSLMSFMGMPFVKLRADKAEALLRRAAAVRTDAQLQPLMREVLAEAMRLIPAAEGGILELLEGQEIVARAVAGTATPHLHTRLPVKGSLSGSCILTGHHVICADSEIDERTHKYASRLAGARSLLIVPLPYQDGHSGNLKFYTDEPDAFTTDDVLLAQLLSGPMTIALSSRAHAEAAQQHSAALKQFAATFEQAAVGMIHASPEGQFLRVNDRFCKIVGHPREKLLRGGFREITHPDDVDKDITNRDAMLAGALTSYSTEKRYLTANGDPVWVNLTVSLVSMEDGSPDFFVGVVEDITDRKSAETAAARDQLTGLLNRRGLSAQMDAALQDHAAKGQSLAVAFFDLDGFKAVNDKYGHAEGDRCLARIAEELGNAVRKEDILARVGGDEFVVVLPGAKEAEAERLIERLQGAIASASDGEQWAVTSSAGGTVILPTAEISAKTVISAADLLMYRAKQLPEHKIVVETFVVEGR